LQVSASTGCLHHLHPDQMADAFAEAGFRWVEILLNGSLMQDLGPLMRALISRGLSVASVHAPFYLDGVISAPGRQDEAAVIGLQVLGLARAVGARAITLHPGHSPPLGFPVRDSLNTALSNIMVLRDLAAPHGIEVLVENTGALFLLGVKIRGQLASTPDEMDRYLGPASAPNLRMTFDTSHASTLRKCPLDAFIHRMNSRIGSVHLSDSNGLVDHLPIGYGRLDFSRVFAALRSVGFSGNAVLEFRPSHSTVAELRRNRVLVETELFQHAGGGQQG